MGTAVIIGASSGIGEALAHELNGGDWRLVLLARRLDRLEAIRQTLAPGTIVRAFDIADSNAEANFQNLLEELGGAALIKRLFVATPAKAARQIFHAIRRQRNHAYITKRYALVALLLKLLPRAF